ncbi:hypothetical protein HY357_02745 [Candidatus Roizmanbacteria bacterium]|nr:hypothetical protein [Candidatus Roizmanbacteria bacterium]
MQEGNFAPVEAFIGKGTHLKRIEVKNGMSEGKPDSHVTHAHARLSGADRRSGSQHEDQRKLSFWAESGAEVWREKQGGGKELYMNDTTRGMYELTKKLVFTDKEDPNVQLNRFVTEDGGNYVVWTETMGDGQLAHIIYNDKISTGPGEIPESVTIAIQAKEIGGQGYDAKALNIVRWSNSLQPTATTGAAMWRYDSTTSVEPGDFQSRGRLDEKYMIQEMQRLASST